VHATTGLSTLGSEVDGGGSVADDDDQGGPEQDVLPDLPPQLGAETDNFPGHVGHQVSKGEGTARGNVSCRSACSGVCASSSHLRVSFMQHPARRRRGCYHPPLLSR